METICKGCGKSFEAKTANRKYCSPECRIYHYKHGIKDRDHDMEPQEGIPLREFHCKKCGKLVRVMTKNDHRSQFCSSRCEKGYYKGGKAKGAKQGRGGGYWEKLCPVCHNPFGSASETKRYCCQECRVKAQLARIKEKRRKSC